VLVAPEQQASAGDGEVWVTWSSASVLVLLVGRLADGDALRLKRRLSGLVDRDVRELVIDCAGASWLSEAVVHALADVARLVDTDGAPDAEVVVVDPPGDLGARLRDRGIATRASRISVLA
jgi:anti-anti-sigma regulatory factor